MPTDEESITTTPEKLAQIVISAMRTAGYGRTDHDDGPRNRKLLTPRDIRAHGYKSERRSQAH